MNAPEMDNNGRLSAEDFVQITCEWDECTWSEHVELMMDYSGFADDDVLKVHQFQNVRSVQQDLAKSDNCWPFLLPTF